MPLHFLHDGDALINKTAVDSGLCEVIRFRRSVVDLADDFELSGVIFVEERDWDSHDAITLAGGDG